MKGAIEGKDLVKENARYHLSCYDNFRLTHMKNSTAESHSKSSDVQDAFEELFRNMEESDECQFTFNDLLEKMKGHRPTKKTLKQKLINKYGSEIIMVERPPKPTVICFRNTGYKVIEKFWSEEKAATQEDERLRIVRAAAAIIREDIRSKVYETSSYPCPEETLDNVTADIPPTLLTFLDDVILKGKKKRATTLTTKRDSIGHSIISAVRPRSFISSILLSTGVYLNRKFGSRLLIDVLYKLGHCVSYTDLSLYEASAIMNSDKKISSDAFIQHVFDNADHNVCTLDGYNTFHSMGGICCVTPRTGVSNQGVIRKLERVPKSHELASKFNIPIICCNHLDNNKLGLQSITFNDATQLLLGDRDKFPAAYCLHIWAQCLQIPNVPSWRGYMEALSHAEDYEVTQVYCLPFVNMPPSNYDTINSVLNHAHVECLRINQKTSFVTFDQPLYAKARELLANDQNNLKGVIVRLGGFHMLMSFLGTIGKIMNGSGLKELLATAYASNTIDHMLTGHAFSRAIRGHLLVYAALGTIIAKKATNIGEEDQLYMKNLVTEFDIRPPTLEELNTSEQLGRISEKMIEIMETLGNVGRTSRLWLQYFNSITLVMQFIEAERLGNWELHLQCVRDMLPFFHAAGHLPYAKSAQVYLQDMLELPNVMDAEEFKKFTEQEFFTVRRSDKKWAGIWTDMTVEQTLMRSMKTSGGLTSGRGVNREGALARWILGMPIAFEVMDAFEAFCGVRAETTEQHTDWRPANMKRDAKDYQLFLEWFKTHDPFIPTDVDGLFSIADGLCGGKEVNCDTAIEIGTQSMRSLIGKSVASATLKRGRLQSLGTAKRGIMFDDEKVTVDTTLLFQRITAVSKNDSNLAREALNYELAPFPLALFDDEGMMRKSAKSKLYEAFLSQPLSSVDLPSCRKVIDGGFLLHKVVWPAGSTYENVFKLYDSFITRNYGANCVVVFDGYNASDIGVKSYERLKRSKSGRSPLVIFDIQMTITVNQEKFLANDDNKSRFINFLKDHLMNTGIDVKQATEDADQLIATTAVEQLSEHEKVAVIGQDVDLLVLLIALTPEDKEIHFIKQGAGKVATAVFSIKDYSHLKDTILFSHAFTGCDTTSALYGKGKKAFLNTLKKRSGLADSVAIFSDPHASRDEIMQAGQSLMLALYAASPKESCINSFRYQRFVASAARLKTEVRLAQLPPTAGSTREHIWRVYFQVQKWLGNDLINPSDWGWKLKDGVYVPTMSELPAAPPEILNMIFCTCKGNCGNRCGCRRTGLKCNTICSGCHGDSCLNSINIDLSSDSVDTSNSADADFLRQLDSTLNQHLDDAESDNGVDFEFPPFSMEDENALDESGPSTSKKRRVEGDNYDDQWYI